MVIKRRRVIRRRDPRSIKLQDMIFSFGREICFVCDKTTKKKKTVYIGRHENGKELFRHEYCSPGSSNWEKKFKVTHSSLLQGRRKCRG